MLLLTGFGPFGKWDTNPSWEIARALDGLAVGGACVAARRLPVDWEEAWPVLLRAIEEIHPRWVLMLGLAGGRPHISVETRGSNVCKLMADNRGRLLGTDLIEAGGPGELASTLPVDSIIDSIRSLGLPVERSDDAGGYLCNYTLYKALTWANSQPVAPKVGFLHVPSLAGEDPEIQGMSLEDMVTAVRAAIEAVVSR